MCRGFVDDQSYFTILCMKPTVQPFGPVYEDFGSIEKHGYQLEYPSEVPIWVLRKTRFIKFSDNTGKGDQ